MKLHSLIYFHFYDALNHITLKLHWCYVFSLYFSTNRSYTAPRAKVYQRLNLKNR